MMWSTFLARSSNTTRFRKTTSTISSSRSISYRKRRTIISTSKKKYKTH